MDEIPVADQLKGFVDDLHESLGQKVCEPMECDSIILCGFGGSAVSGDIASDCCYMRSKKRICPWKYPTLPSWAGKDTLVVVSSYSGNTAEALEAYRDSKAKGCRTICLTSGGVLESYAKDNGDTLVSLPKGMQPRHAIGHMIGLTLGIIHSAGGPDLSGEIRSMIPFLRRYRDDITYGKDSDVNILAKDLEGCVPVVCSDPCMRSVAFRWKTQFNENSKMVAFYGTTPGICSEMEQWSMDRDNIHLVYLVDCGPDGEDRGGCLIDSGPSADMPITEILLGGYSSLENLFRAIILGDHLSVRMAHDRGIDAAGVPPVMQLKAKLQKAGRQG